MAKLFSGLWNWIAGTPQTPELLPNLIFERDVYPENNFWISCIFDPTMEVKYVNGVVTSISDTDKCMINGIYHYQPKTEKEICNFPYLDVNSPVRISVYRKKNSTEAWRVASCFLFKETSSHKTTGKPSNFDQWALEEPAIKTDKSVENLKKKNYNIDDEDMSVEVLGDMPKIINFNNESTIQILFRNKSYTTEYELLDYHIVQENRSQLSIVNKVKLPIKIGIQLLCIFDINLQGKFLGRSTEKVLFIFKDMKYKVGININVTDSRIILPDKNAEPYTKKEVDVQRLFELQNDNVIRGISFGKKTQFSKFKIGSWNIPDQLTKCFWTSDGKMDFDIDEVERKIAKVYPAAFDVLSYENYKVKFHALLYVEEIQQTFSLQKYAKERVNFETNGEYLVLRISGLSEKRPSLVPGDKIAVTDPPHCEKRLGNSPGQYEGVIHKVEGDKILLKFDPEFHKICGHWDYSVNFFASRMGFRKKHEVVNESWKKHHLGETFLFPYKDIKYQTPRLAIASLGDTTDFKNCLSPEVKTLVAPPKVVNRIRWFNEKLNCQQKSAVINVLKAEVRPMPYVIYGPPGTGKTVTLTECIIQVYKEFPKSKLLICAPSNYAVDILLKKLINTGLFNKTIMRRIISYSYYLSMPFNPEFDDYISLPILDNSHGGSENDIIDSKKLITKKDILNLRMVITTEGSASVLHMMGLKSGTFSHIFVDEAGQTMEPEILLPLSFLDFYRGGQVVLAGDPKQLGPFVLSFTARRNGLELSMLARLINYPLYQSDPDLFPKYNGFNPKIITHLIQNYRSLPEIVDYFSQFFYNSLLQAIKTGDSVHERVFLNNLTDNVHWDIDCKGPIVVHGIKGTDSRSSSCPSWFNPQEAFQTLLYFTKLMKSGLSADDIGIVTPYLAQVSKIQELMKMYFPDTPLPKIGTVDMFQGQEKMVIIISLVRSQSNAGREEDRKFNLGFLLCEERINVVLSRAKSLMIVIGDPFTMMKVKVWKSILLREIKNNNYIGCDIPAPDDTTATIYRTF